MNIFRRRQKLEKVEIPSSEFSNPYSKYFNLSKTRELYLKASVAKQVIEGNISSVGQIMQELWKDNIEATLKELDEKNKEWLESVDEIKLGLERQSALNEAREVVKNGRELPLLSNFEENDRFSMYFIRIYYDYTNDVFHRIMFNKKEVGKKLAERKITDNYGNTEIVEKEWPIYDSGVVILADTRIVSLDYILYEAGRKNIAKQELVRAMSEGSFVGSPIEFEYPSL